MDFKSEEGRRVAVDLIGISDIVLLNKSDEQIEAMGLGREALDQINKKAIHLNVQASILLASIRSDQMRCCQCWSHFYSVTR